MANLPSAQGAKGRFRVCFRGCRAEFSLNLDSIDLVCKLALAMLALTIE